MHYPSVLRIICHQRSGIGPFPANQGFLERAQPEKVQASENTLTSPIELTFDPLDCVRQLFRLIILLFRWGDLRCSCLDGLVPPRKLCASGGAS
jgi:hypothetical protein